MVWALMQSIGEATTMFPNGETPLFRSQSFETDRGYSRRVHRACLAICRSGVQFLHGLALLLHVERLPRI